MSTLNMELFQPNNRKFTPFLLAFFSVSGSALGVAAARTVDPYVFSMMRQAICMPVSIVDLLFAVLFPFVITAVISYISEPLFLLPMCFLKTLCYSYLLCSVCMVFVNAGWMVGSMLLFSDSVCMFLLFCYWLQNLNGIRNNFRRDIVISAVIVFITVILDVYVVSQFLMVLMKI